MQTYRIEFETESYEMSARDLLNRSRNPHDNVLPLMSKGNRDAALDFAHETMREFDKRQT
jgi:hypothetical protein